MGLVLAGIAIYAHTLHYPTQFDDKTYVERNRLIRNTGYYAELLHPFSFARTDEELGIQEDCVTNFALRPVSYLTFTFNYLVGGTDPVGYRLFNIAVHIANAMLVYLVLLRMLGLPDDVSPPDTFTKRFVPAAAAFLFLVHPLQTESVIYIVQRFTSVATLFYLLTILLYLDARAAGPGTKRKVLQVGAVAALVCGMLSKEIAFTAPLVLLLLELVIFGSRLKDAVRRTAVQLACLPLLPVMIVIMATAQGAGTLLAGSINVVNLRGYPPLDYAITQLAVVVSYLRLLLLPYGQNVDPDFPLYGSLLQGRVLLSLALLLVIVAGSVALYRANRRDLRRRLLMFGIIWFFVTLAVTSSFVPLSDLMAERRVYLSCVGLFAALAALLDLARSRWDGVAMRRGIVAFTAGWVVALSGATYARSLVWRSGVALWRDTVAKSPCKVRPNYNLGVSLESASRYGEAVPYLRKVIAMDPRHFWAYRSLGHAYNKLGRYNDAINLNNRAIALGTRDAGIYSNLGVAYYRLGQLNDARMLIEYAILLGNWTAEARVILGEIYFQLGRREDAAEQLSVVEAGDPEDADVVAQIRDLRRRLAGHGPPR